MTLVTPEIRAAKDAALDALISLADLKAANPHGFNAAALCQFEEALGDVICSTHRLETADALLLEREAHEAQAA